MDFNMPADDPDLNHEISEHGEDGPIEVNEDGHDKVVHPFGLNIVVAEEEEELGKFQVLLNSTWFLLMS